MTPIFSAMRVPRLRGSAWPGPGPSWPGPGHGDAKCPELRREGGGTRLASRAANMKFFRARHLAAMVVCLASAGRASGQERPPDPAAALEEALASGDIDAEDALSPRPLPLAPDGSRHETPRAHQVAPA